MLELELIAERIKGQRAPWLVSGSVEGYGVDIVSPLHRTRPAIPPNALYSAILPPITADGRIIIK